VHRGVDDDGDYNDGDYDDGDYNDGDHDDGDYDYDDMDGDGDGDPPPVLPERSTAHDALQNPHYTEKFNDKYADARAGLCIGEEQNTNSQYQTGMLDRMNTWSPFSSRLDWEVARWAKLRGPSSTAFSELLAINGVSGTLHLCQVLDLIDVHRFASAWASRTRIQ
jgi:hypothetical protein